MSIWNDMKNRPLRLKNCPNCESPGATYNPKPLRTTMRNLTGGGPVIHASRNSMCTGMRCGVSTAQQSVN